jgi:ATP-dependent exoDNAse (exonuclease V) alpha subunit
LIIAPGQDDRAIINQAVRDGLIAEGTIKQNGFEAVTLERKGLTRAEIRSPQSYEPGQVVRFGRGYANSGIGKGSYWEVASVDAKTVRLSRDGQELAWNPASQSKVEVYRTVNRELGEGDKIIFTKNDRESGLVNGQTAVVRHLDAGNGQAHVITRDGEVREVNLSSNRHWNHGYVITAHAAKGATADRVLIHAESHRSNLRNQCSLYVGISKARDEARVFTDDVAKLRETVSDRTGEKKIALGGKDFIRADLEFQEPGQGRERDMDLGRER